MPEPTVAELLARIPSYYGVRVIEFDDAPPSDIAEFIALTHNRRRALAAVNRYLRERWGDRLTLKATRPRWIAFDTNCGCGPAPQQEHLDAADGSGPWCDCGCDSDLPPCGDRYSWTVCDTRPEHGLPATEVHLT